MNSYSIDCEHCLNSKTQNAFSFFFRNSKSARSGRSSKSIVLGKLAVFHFFVSITIDLADLPEFEFRKNLIVRGNCWCTPSPSVGKNKIFGSNAIPQSLVSSFLQFMPVVQTKIVTYNYGFLYLSEFSFIQIHKM